MEPYTGPTISSDFGVVNPASLDNRICRTCGLIFNAKGVRESTTDFYRNTYSLLLHTKEAGVTQFFDNRQVSQAKLSYELLAEQLSPAQTGRLFEVGAGKGHFLRYFQADFPDWELAALEPSQAHHALLDFLPQENVFPCGYTEHALSPASQDIIVALGVLEHVTNPLDMLRWMYQGLVPGGRCFIRVPNFRNNPNDLYCVDHLSKLTTGTLAWLAAQCGFGFRVLRETGVPVFIELTRGSGVPEPVNAYCDNKALAEANANIATKSLKTIEAVRKTALEHGENFAIFGLAASGLFAPFACGFPAEEITAYIDENKALSAMHIHGRPVGGLDLIEKLRIRHIALTISPAYWNTVKAKLEPYGATVSTPSL